MVRPLTDADRTAIAQWRYGGELSLYSPGEGAAELRAPDHVALASPEGELLGYGTLGLEAQVPGGAYGDSTDALDLGLGLRPDLVGHGLGADALAAVIAHARQHGGTTRFRATVASANGRATALVMHAGFEAAHRFTRSRDGREFVQYVRAFDSEC